MKQVLMAIGAFMFAFSITFLMLGLMSATPASAHPNHTCHKHATVTHCK